MFTFMFIPFLLIVKFKLLGSEIKAFCAFVDSGYSEYAYLGLASLFLLWGSLVGYFAHASWVFFRKSLGNGF